MAKSNTNPPAPTGWLCPHCNTVYNPTVKSCDCQKKAVQGEADEKGIDIPFSGIKITPTTIFPPTPYPTNPWIPNDPRKPMLGGQMPTSTPPSPYAKWDPSRQMWLKGCSASMCNCTGRCREPVGTPDNFSGFALGTFWNE